MRATLAALALVVALIAPTAAAAATITVDTTDDVSVSQCTLRAAIRAANFNAVEAGCAAGSGADTIQFSLPAESTITLGSKLPPVNSAIEINGPGSDQLTVSGGGAAAAFEVTAEASISGLTVADTKCTSACALYNSGILHLSEVSLRDNEAIGEGGTNIFAGGAAIYNNGSLELADSSLIGNVAEAGAATGQNSSAGGAIVNSVAGEMTIVRSTLEGNEAVATPAAGGTTNVHGGAISNVGKLTIRNSALVGNSVSATGSTVGNAAEGGAIADGNSMTVEVSIDRTTITGNSVIIASPESLSGGGGLTASGVSFQISGSTIAGNSAKSSANIRGSTAEIRNTIVAEPLGGGSSCTPAMVSLGFNLDEGTSCGFNQASDLSSTDPLLAPAPADNGGPTPTITLQTGSPAIDQGLSAAGELTDQRGFLRPVDIASIPDAPGSDGTDIGAFEVQIPRVSILGGPAEGATIGETEPTFSFLADEPGASFVCALDGGAPAACTSPDKLSALANGSHTFSVTALSPLGYAGPPEARTFTVNVPSSGDGSGSGSGTGGGGGSGGGTPPPPQVAPETTLSPLPARTHKRRLTIRFSSSQAGSTFACKLDKKAWKPCPSPLKTPKLAFGKHTFKVRATSAGLADPTPAKKTFRVLRPAP